MKRIIGSVVMALMFLATGIAASESGPADPGVQNRLARQQQRIDQGIASGELTRAEADSLQENLNRIRAEEDRLKADGRLTETERIRLHRELERSNYLIYKKKHNFRAR